MVADSTSPEYWMAIGAVGGILLVGMVSVRIRGWVPVALAVLGTAMVAAAFVAAYTVLGQG